jgi:hypothetical protein
VGFSVANPSAGNPTVWTAAYLFCPIESILFFDDSGQEMPRHEEKSTPGHAAKALRDPPEATRDSLDSLETRFRRAYGREMTPEERKFFALVERLVRFEPDRLSKPQKSHDLKREDEAPTAPIEEPDPSDPGSSKAA